MIADRDQIIQGWAAFQAQTGGIKRPVSEEEYLELTHLMHTLLDHHDCTQEPYASLLDVVGTYMQEWETQHETWLEADPTTPAEMLEALMQEHHVSQAQLEREGLADQGLLSNILSGKRQISKTLAKRLGERFKVSAEVFL